VSQDSRSGWQTVESAPALQFERFFDRLIFRPRRTASRELFHFGFAQAITERERVLSISH
jgi:hypothetical protein